VTLLWLQVTKPNLKQTGEKERGSGYNGEGWVTLGTYLSLATPFCVLGKKAW
jgi:hypothetical protein